MGWTLLGSWTGAAVQVATTMVLARLLTPADFGLMAMALTLTVVVTQFRQLGLSQAVVQRPDLTWNQVNSLFWVNTAAGIVLAGVVAVSGFPLAAFYDEPSLVPICAALGAGFVVSGVSVQHGALLNRAMQFRRIALRNATAGLLASATAVVAALLGMGVWSLVIQNVSALLLATVLNWWAVPWRPGRPRRLGDAVPLLRFGAHVSVASLFHTASREGDNVIIGRFLDAGALGLYTRAYSLLMLPLKQLKTPVQAVMVPTLAALQGEPARYRKAYRTAISGLCHAGLPLVVVLAVAADEVILVALGEQWLAAARIFQLLAVASFVQLVSTTTGWIYTSTGRGRPYVVWAVVGGIVTVGGFLVGVRWGVEGVAASYAISQVALFVPGFVLACRNSPVRLSDPFRAMARPAVIAGGVLAVSVVVRSVVAREDSVFLTLAAVVAAALVVWAAAMMVWPSARRELSGLVESVRTRRRGDAKA
ncbi:lipopolysaccharide biosynthesis protein [Oceanitalea stevensii]|uniref:Lipopolysaccharide biosynthesis protein n=1 Tax=Oceanitalea stevensii TaxID=2763072 RepID=A0ABR8Z037_9MICO|nr:lipopolysaccharide biosynthesis protein [Oceanitalea stevensii]MBD8061614.1 lipopolysaccharide biosynthesis protein [Oceanitalea stevensii]